MKILRKIISVLTIIIFALALFIIINASIKIRNQQVPNLFGYSYFNVKTESMKPTINVNDFIIVKKVNNYQVDDIVSFYYDVNNDGRKEVVTHQIIDIQGNKVITHGVNNPINKNEEINSSDIIGKVVYKSPFLGKLLSNKLITNKFYIISFIIICLLVFIGFQVVNIIKLLKKDSNIK